MTETVSVSVSGAAFSLLLYENIKSEYDQDGFLLGCIVSKETNKLTDADHRVINREQIINVKSALPCPQQFYFYDNSGSIDTNKIKRLLGDQEERVVGWYTYKRKDTALSLSLREKIIHKQLVQLFCPRLLQFTCCLLNSGNSEIRATHSFSQSFIRYHNSKYENLPLHLINLSDPSYTFKTAEPVSDLLNKTVKSIKSTGETEGHVIIKKVQESLQQHMSNLVEKLAGREQELFKLEQEVKQLKYNLKLKHEYGAEEMDLLSEVEVAENGVPESNSFESTPSTDIENISDTPKKKRGRPCRQVKAVQNNSTVNPTINSDAIGDHLKENENITNRSSRSANKINSYAEMAQKRKN